MLRKYFISNITIMLLLNLLVKPLWIFMIDRNVQLTVGHAEYGLYGALVGLTIIFNILLDMGITNYNNKHLAANKNMIVDKLPNMIVAKAILSLIYFTIILVVAFLLQYNTRAINLVFLLAIVQMLNSFLLFLRSNVSANHHFKTDSMLSVLDKLLMILICGFLLFNNFYHQHFKIEWFIYAQIVAYAIASLVALFIVISRYSKIHFAHFSIKETLNICKKSLPYALLILFMGIYMRSDTLLLERIEGATQNSIYLEAYRILDAVNMIAFLFAGILLPMFSRMISQNLNIENLVSTSANIMISSSLALVAFCIVFAMPIMSVLYHNVDSNLIITFSVVIGSFPAFCIMYIYSTLLTANGNIKLLVKIAMFGSFFSISLNAILIHYFHSIGAAITCFAVEWLMGFIYIFYCIKYFNLPVNYIRIIKFLMIFVSHLLFNIIIHYFDIKLLAAIFSNAILFLLLVYIIRLWDKTLILSFFKQYTSMNDKS